MSVAAKHRYIIDRKRAFYATLYSNDAPPTIILAFSSFIATTFVAIKATSITELFISNRITKIVYNHNLS